MGKIDDTDIREGFRTRRLTTEDLDQYNALLRYAFQVTEMDLKKAGWKDYCVRLSKRDNIHCTVYGTPYKL